MSRSRHPRKKARLFSNHQRNWKEWKGDSLWKPAERPIVDEAERRSARVRSGDNGWPGRPRLRR